MTKEEFKSIPHIERLIRLKTEELNRLRELAVSLDGNNMGVRVTMSKMNNSMVKVDKIVDLENSIKKDKQKLIALRTEAYKLISELPCLHDKEIMERRYILGQSWGQIAIETGYTERHILRLHGYIIKKIF